jgi:cobalt-zinc-cadmium efflux system outer membrane protein
MFKGIYLQESRTHGAAAKNQARSRRRSHIAYGLGRCPFAGRVPRPVVGEGSTSDCCSAPAEPLSLAKAIELALEGNPEVAAATRQWEATEGQVLQGRSRPNPELAYSLEDARSKTRTQSWQLNLPVELGGKRAARTKAAEKSREQAQAQLAELQGHRAGQCRCSLL